MKAQEHQTLFYQNEETNSDKVYEVWLEEDETGLGFFVWFAYGRYGSELKQGIKNSDPVDYDEAKLIYNKLIDSKVKKGYSF